NSLGGFCYRRHSDTSTSYAAQLGGRSDSFAEECLQHRVVVVERGRLCGVDGLRQPFDVDALAVVLAHETNSLIDALHRDPNRAFDGFARARAYVRGFNAVGYRIANEMQQRSVHGVQNVAIQLDVTARRLELNFLV